MRPLPQNGFTLLELLLYVSVSGVLLVGVVSFLIVLQTARVKQTTIGEVEQQGQQAIDYITQLIRNAEAVTTPTPGTESSSLTLDVVDSANDPTTVDLSGGTLQVAEGSGSSVALTSDTVTISDLTFINNAATSTRDSITIRFTIQYRSSTVRQEYQYETSFTATANVQPN